MISALTLHKMIRGSYISAQVLLGLLNKLGIGLTHIFVTSKHQRQTRECSGSVVENLT